MPGSGSGSLDWFYSTVCFLGSSLTFFYLTTPPLSGSYNHMVECHVYGLWCVYTSHCWIYLLKKPRWPTTAQAVRRNCLRKFNELLRCEQAKKNFLQKFLELREVPLSVTEPFNEACVDACGLSLSLLPAFYLFMKTGSPCFPGPGNITPRLNNVEQLVSSTSTFWQTVLTASSHGAAFSSFARKF